jgi:hypothetical protein
MMIRKARASFSENYSTIIPGYLPKTEIFGMAPGFDSPGWDFVGGRFSPFQAMSSTISGPGSGSPEHEAQLITQLLFSRQRGDQRAWAIVNAALLIYAAGLAPSLAQATPLAQNTLDSGKAGAFLTALVQGRAPQTTSPIQPAPAGMPA